MAVMELWRRRDLEGMVQTEYLQGNFFSLDADGNLIGVTVYQNGAPAALSGSVTGYCVLPDGTTVAVAGTRSGNKAYMTVPQSALGTPGPLGIVMKLTDGNTITTLLSIVATVYRSRTDTVITPSSQVIEDWASTISAALQEVEDASAEQDEKISQIENAVEQIVGPTRNLNITGCGRYYANSSGVIGSSNNNYLGMADKIPCEEGTQYTVKFYGASSPQWAIYAFYYDSNGDYLSNEKQVNMTADYKTFTTPESTAYVFFHLYKEDGLTVNDPHIQVEEGITPTEYIIPYSAIDSVARSEIVPIMQDATTNITITENSGYINSTGSVVAQSSTYLEVYTNKIPVKGIAKIDYLLEYTSEKEMWLAYATYNSSGEFLSRSTLVNYVDGTEISGEITVGGIVCYVVFTYRTFGVSTFSVTGKISISKMYNSQNPDAQIETDRNTIRSAIGSNPCRFKPFYDHVFIDKINGSNVTIPSESLFNIQISRRLGFNMIEANVQPTSDNNFIVMHGSQGKFGAQVQHVDGETDISNTSISSVTLEWIKENVRYKSLYEKYRVAPPSLEEFLLECRKNCMIPMVTMRNAGARAIVDSIMGAGNYVAYNGTRETTSAPILTYPSLTTKADILDLCRSYGVPYMYCMANPSYFTDAQLEEIVNALHAEGYWIGYAGSYQTEAESQRLLALGFDFCASNYQINEFESGNLCNLSADIDYSDFTTTGTVADNLLTLQENDTLAPNATIPSVFLGGSSLHIRFDGTISIRMGSYINSEITSDGTQSIWFSTYYLNSSPTFLITATAETKIINIDFKASKM